MEDFDWQVLSGKGWPQLRECVYVALVALKKLGGEPPADKAAKLIREILAEGAHDPATRVTYAPPPELRTKVLGVTHPGR